MFLYEVNMNEEDNSDNSHLEEVEENVENKNLDVEEKIRRK